MKRNPYLIEGPALISFSGGRTSAFMLFMILLAFDGKLPDNIYVVFANTGKEREETLRFVHEVESRWEIRIWWVQRTEDGSFDIVGYNSAARNGEPFEALIRQKQYLPNAVTRFCTIELKIRVMRDFARSVGFERWDNIVGLRYDEPLRIFKALARNDEGKERFTSIMPLSKGKVTKRDVMEFWQSQPFDLQLLSVEGNCDLCFLKGEGKIASLMRDNAGMADWWIEQEDLIRPSKPSGARFITERSYRELQTYVDNSPTFDDVEYDSECGLYCGPEASAITLTDGEQP